MAERPVFMACGVPKDAPAEVWSALEEVARAAIRSEEARRAALSPTVREAEDVRRVEGLARLERIRRRAWEGEPDG
jgi:hypothetical protein